MLRILGIMSLSLLFSIEAFGLPAYRRLFEKKYGYKVSCQLCHQLGGGSSATPYGNDFRKNGMGFSAYAAIEDLDSDGDGVKNGIELKKKSNPGDPLSLPEKPGTWLVSAESIPIPAKELEQVFGAGYSFSAIEGVLDSKQVSEIESLGVTLNEVDKVPTFYFAEKNNKKEAVLQYVSTKQPISVTMLVGMSAEGKIHRLKVLTNKEISDSDVSLDYRNQYVGKSELKSIEMDKLKLFGTKKSLATAFNQVVKKSLLTIQKVFSAE